MVDPLNDPWSSDERAHPGLEGEPLESDSLDAPAPASQPQDIPALMDTEIDTPVISSISAVPPSSSTPPAQQEPKHPAFPIVLGVSLAGVIAASCFLNPQPSVVSGSSTPVAVTPAPAPTPAASTPAPAPVTLLAAAEPAAEPKAKETVDPAETDAGESTTGLATEIKGFQAKLDTLAASLKKLEGRVGASPKPDAASLEARIAELSKASAIAAELPKQAASLNERLSKVEKTVGTFQAELAAIKEQLKRVGTGMNIPPLPATGLPVDPNSIEQAISQGADVFKAGNFIEASNLFLRLTETYPEDARVWYYAALSNGFATNQWQAEPLRMVTRGVEREKAGTPEASKINALVESLNIPSAKTWLDYYRKAAPR